MKKSKKGEPAEESQLPGISRLSPEEETRFAAPAPQIEGYEILGKLGEAGQGQIWRALQVSTQREVALKVPRGGLISSEKALARFEREVELAARLKHPNIARIHDSGIHHGLYYYAMDLIEGVNLDEYVRQHHLSQRQILQLMRTICQAIQHAHQNGVIHRDMKPSNIVVAKDGHPYIVDFGLAKGFLKDDLVLTVSTDGEAAGTPAYMSPEQAAGHMDKLDTRTDVYSLGAILFTLLTGHYPHDLSGSRFEVLHRITEEEVKRPRKICPKIDKEVELLLLKALDNDPDRRYAAAGMLAQDIDNYLTGAPLVAGPESGIYHIKKFVRRHRALVTGIAAVLAVLVAGVVVSTLFAIGQARARAEAQAVSDFLTTSVLRATNPVDSEAKAGTVLSVLDAVSEGLEGRFKDRPVVEAPIRYELGMAYWRLGQLDTAEEHLKRGLQIDVIPDKVQPMQTLGQVYRGQGRLDEAELQCKKALELGLRLLGAEHERTLWCMNALAAVYGKQGRYDEAESLYKDMLSISRRVFGEKHATSKLSTGNLANIYRDQGQFDEAERLFLRLLELWPDIVNDQTHMSFYTSCLAAMYAQQGRYEEAESLFLKVLENRRIQRGDTHPGTLKIVDALGRLYKDQNRYDKAEAFLMRAVWGRRLILGDEHPDTLDSWNSLIELYEAWGKPEKAEQWRTKLPSKESIEKQ